MGPSIWPVVSCKIAASVYWYFQGPQEVACVCQSDALLLKSKGIFDFFFIGTLCQQVFVYGIKVQQFTGLESGDMFKKKSDAFGDVDLLS